MNLFLLLLIFAFIGLAGAFARLFWRRFCGRVPDVQWAMQVQVLTFLHFLFAIFLILYLILS